ncbi:flagellar basal body P-ring formation protein FlgA [Pseudoalteromonas sp. MMG010]|uniref:flagellar basal body P-ring formation chaperone FlgA n=1 Tax=Pseudoalteromonas sp. MMG010 TaxID=2822685 RepID=UPI001B39E434|nr:flagellar basal body P-ring formation chaperone FlgA [Pseudoalteromonas sp. MMG010]MBQ4831812.1 flagellar basal body P-ring formation protein FlgA [Pseudoalteromonas sp. MMG010]
MSLLKKSRRCHFFYFLVSLFLFFPVKAKVFTKEALAEIATNYVEAKIKAQTNPPTGLELSVAPLDPRIADRNCDSELVLSTPSEPPFNRQVTLQAKCNDTNSWVQYIHVRVVKMSPVVIANTNLARGEIITTHSLRVTMKPSHFVRAQSLQSPELFIGSRSKRNIREGMPVMLNQICMVCKGDSVSIYASLRGLKIKTTGIALEDGVLGEQVKIKNKKSGKVLNARVDGVESVSVNI